MTHCSPSDKDVVLLHGLGRNSRIMDKMAGCLARVGYRVYNLDYPSTRYSIEELTAQIAARITALRKDFGRPLQFVGHSLGAIIAHYYIQSYHPPHLGRVVGLGPPYRGSEIIDHLGRYHWYRRLQGPAALELGTTNEEGISGRLNPANYELGVIAGNRWHFSDWFFAHYWLPIPNDGKVSVASTHLEGCRHHLVLPVNHVWLPKYSIVIEQTVYFLEYGQFSN